MAKNETPTTFTFHEVTEEHKGDSWKMWLTGVYAMSEKTAKRPPKDVRVIRAGAHEHPAPSDS